MVVNALCENGLPSTVKVLLGSTGVGQLLSGVQSYLSWVKVKVVVTVIQDQFGAP